MHVHVPMFVHNKVGIGEGSTYFRQFKVNRRHNMFTYMYYTAISHTPSHYTVAVTPTEAAVVSTITQSWHLHVHVPGTGFQC